MTRSQRDRQLRLVLLCMAALVIVAWLDLRLQSGSWHDLALGLLPNVIAGLLGVLGASIVVPWLLTDKDRLRYIDATSSIRAALRSAREAQRIAPQDVQLVMKEVVPAVSSLYFGSPKPRVRKEDSLVSQVTFSCGICSLDCGVAHGACHHCGELMEVFADMRPRPATSESTNTTNE